ncbi:MAG: alpha-amylase family glycosyl hydrolase, partial [Bacteroidales bacterium]
MKKTFKWFGLALVCISGIDLYAQIITADPAFPVPGDPVVITFDASQGSQGLMGYTGDVYAHTGVITSESTSSSDWRHAPSWGDNSPKYKLERIADDLYQLVIEPSINEYYNILEGEEVMELAFVFRSSDSSLEGKTETGGDIFYPVYSADMNVRIVQPDQRPLIVKAGDTLLIEVEASLADSLILYYNGEERVKTSDSQISDTLIVNYGQEKSWIRAVAKNDTSQVADSLYFITREDVEILPVPSGMEDGINYTSDTTATLVLYAPGKSYVYLIGSFNDWEIKNEYQLNLTPDGKRFWITLDSLEPGREYLYQYLVDGTIRISDPYTEKVSDPQDKYITEVTYPGLIPYPEGKTTGIAASLQTGQAGYNWQHQEFSPPSTDELIIYELLVRDFIESHDYRTLIDTVAYFKKLGVNAIELMPVNEFEGNSSWGYNTSHYFALDKYYGPKKDLQRLIDTCHSQGIAVILDVVLNHSFGQSPLVKLYWDAQNNRPSADSPWFNQIPKHEFNVGYDINHESEATRYLVGRVLRYWLKEYHVDGYRMDLSKGFTQTNTLGDANAMARYDASRIAILEAYADSVWSVNPGAYVILEHFADNDEEQELTDYGMMVWGNSQYNYARAGMGWNYDNKSNFSWGSYKTRGFSKPHLVTYMESHDEQRQMYDILRWGNYNNPFYNVRNNLEIGLVRGELCAAFFFTMPGPKMLWQFGEMGYDYDLYYNNDKLGPKPIRWDYLENPNRQRLFQVYSTLAHLKTSEPVFKTTDFSFDVEDTIKTIQLRSEEMDVTIVGNFDTYPRTADPFFTKTGTWYDYFSGDSLEVTDTHMTLELDKSEYRIYTSSRLQKPDLIVAPMAKDVYITGNQGIGEELNVHYTYFDQNGDPEGASVFRWYRGKESDGSDKLQILGAVGQTLTITEEDWNHYIFAEVTPVAASGGLTIGLTETGILDLAVSVPDQERTEREISVFPNPVKEGFHVRI